MCQLKYHIVYTSTNLRPWEITLSCYNAADLGNRTTHINDGELSAMGQPQRTLYISKDALYIQRLTAQISVCQLYKIKWQQRKETFSFLVVDVILGAGTITHGA